MNKLNPFLLFFAAVIFIIAGLIYSGAIGKSKVYEIRPYINISDLQMYPYGTQGYQQGIEQQIKNIDEKLSAISSDLKTLTDKLNTIDSKLTQVSQRLSKIENTISSNQPVKLTDPNRHIPPIRSEK